MRALFILTLALFLFLGCTTTKQYTKQEQIERYQQANLCHDPKAEEEWLEIVRNNPSPDFHALHALRIGLCLKIERGDLPFAMAHEIFEQARQDFIQRMKEREQKRARSLML